MFQARALLLRLRFKVMAYFGVDFHKAKREWLYPKQKQQGFWRAVGIFVLLFAIFQVFQVIISLLVYKFGFGHSLMALMETPTTLSPNIMKAFLVSMFPAAIPTLILGLYLSKFGLPHRAGTLPLSWPNLGAGGWIAIILGFVVLMLVLMNLVYWVSGFDSAIDSGLVENMMSNMAKEPILYILALPSIILAAPLAEEFLFRGVLFSGLSNSYVGRAGAVVITSALWSLAHAGPAPWINVGLIFIMGLVLGILLLRFGSLWVTIACHLVWNGLTSLMLFVLGTSL